MDRPIVRHAIVLLLFFASVVGFSEKSPGASLETPEQVTEAFLNGSLQSERFDRPHVLHFTHCSDGDCVDIVRSVAASNVRVHIAPADPTNYDAFLDVVSDGERELIWRPQRWGPLKFEVRDLSEVADAAPAASNRFFEVLGLAPLQEADDSKFDWELRQVTEQAGYRIEVVETLDPSKKMLVLKAAHDQLEFEVREERGVWLIRRECWLPRGATGFQRRVVEYSDYDKWRLPASVRETLYQPVRSHGVSSQVSEFRTYQLVEASFDPPPDDRFQLYIDPGHELLYEKEDRVYYVNWPDAEPLENLVGSDDILRPNVTPPYWLNALLVGVLILTLLIGGITKYTRP